MSEFANKMTIAVLRDWRVEEYISDIFHKYYCQLLEAVEPGSETQLHVTDNITWI